MEYYYKYIDESGKTIGVVSYSPNKPNITDPLIVEIEREEFEAYLAEIAEPDVPSDEATETDYLEALSEMGVEVE